MKQTGWSQSLVSASRGKPDPQSTACILETSFSTDRVCGLQSRQEQHGGMQWVRSLLHRRNGYFVVLDQLTAAEADTYLLVCRWRSFHQGGMIGPATFEAVDGMNQVRFRLLAATPAAWTVETEKQDGAARPTVVRQIRREALKAGERVTFLNLFTRRTNGIRASSRPARCPTRRCSCAAGPRASRNWRPSARTRSRCPAWWGVSGSGTRPRRSWYLPAYVTANSPGASASPRTGNSIWPCPAPA